MPLLQNMPEYALYEKKEVTMKTWVKLVLAGLGILILAVLGIKVKNVYKKAKAEQK